MLALVGLLLLNCTLAFSHFPVLRDLRKSPMKPNIVFALMIGLKALSTRKAYRRTLSPSLLIIRTSGITLLGWLMDPTYAPRNHVTGRLSHLSGRLTAKLSTEALKEQAVAQTSTSSHSSGALTSSVAACHAPQR